jgi:hypothetical protein
MAAAIEDPCPMSVAASSAADVLAFVDDLRGDAAGELVFAGREAAGGAVFVERGRVCWAAASGLASRLSDLLATSARVDRAAMEQHYRACRRERRPLGEYLVGTGIVSPEALRAALLRHTAESLLTLCGPGDRAAWSPRRAGGYNPQFTFTTVELLPWALGEAYRELVAPAASELAASFDGEEWGAAFVRSPARAAPEPIAVHGAAPEKLAELFALGRWAASSLDVAAPLHGRDPLVSIVVGAGAFVAWRAGPLVVAGRTRPNGPARLLNRRASARRKEMSR